MFQSLFVSDRVNKMVSALPEEERRVVAGALVDEFVKGENPLGRLTSLQAMLYAVVRYYIRRDSGCIGFVAG